MKIEKISLDGKKSTIEVLDKVVSSKVNKKFLYNQIFALKRLVDEIDKFLPENLRRTNQG